jgi:uncharacterized delta-60 repeat protein
MILNLRRLMAGIPSHRVGGRPRRRAAARVRVEGLEDRPLLNAADLVPGFGSGGVVTTTLPGTDGSGAIDLVIQSDGKFVAVGSGATRDGNDFALVRYNADGTLDPSFGAGGQVQTPFPNTGGAIAISAALEPDGKILVAGDAFPAGGSSGIGVALARYNADGALDPSFGDHGLVVDPLGDYVTGVALDGQGRILIWGQGPQSATSLVRFEADGQLDQTFGVGGVASSDLYEDPFGSSPRSLAVEPDGQIIVAGIIYDAAIGNYVFAVERYNTDGTPDPSFGMDGVATAGLGGAAERATGLALEPDGKIVVFGDAFGGVTNPNFNAVFGLARFDSDGRLDAGFGTGGFTVDPSSVGSPMGIAIEPDGKIVLVGNQTHYGPSYDPYANYDTVTLSRYDADGLPDPTFGVGGTTAPWTSPRGNDASAVTFAPNGTFVVAGTSNDSYGQTPTFEVAQFRGLDLTAAAPVVGVRGQALTFTGSFDGQADAPVSEVTWSFGDGTRPVTFSGRDAQALTPTHAYAADGAYTIRLTVRYATGLSITTTAKVTIQSVALEPEPRDPSLTDLVVGGTSQDDTILFLPGTRSNTVMVMLDGLCLGTYAPTGWIVAYGQGGDDLISVDHSITFPAELFAGSGDDTLIGGGGRNILIGGSGDDTLIGGEGRNILIGGSGASTLVAGPSGDILIGGTTAYDTNAAALRSLSDEWSLGGSYLARYLALSDGQGLNRPYALNATTISASRRHDTLIGGQGQDLFYAQVRTDLILDRAANEILVPIHPKKRRTDLIP